MEPKTLLDRQQTLIFLCLVLTVGIVLVVIHAEMWGAALVGAAIGGGVCAVIAQKTDNRVGQILERQQADSRVLTSVEQRVQLLSGSADYPFFTSEADLSKYRRVYHSYHRTRDKDREFWWYSIEDFTEVTPGRLTGRVVLRKGAGAFEYKIHGFLVGLRLIMIREPQHSENMSVSIFKNVGTLQAEEGLWGVIQHDDWVEADGLDPCLLFLQPFSNDPPGPAPQDLADLLKSRWEKLRPRVVLEYRKV